MDTGIRTNLSHNATHYYWFFWFTIW